MTEKKGYVYILTNTNNTVLYTGVTSNLVKRIYEHKHKEVRGFTEKYNQHKLIYYEIFEDMVNAISNALARDNYRFDYSRFASYINKQIKA